MEPLSHRHRSESLHPDYFDNGFERRDSYKNQGMELVKLLRVSIYREYHLSVSTLCNYFQEAEQHKFTADEVQAALLHCKVSIRF